jgi:hypothetical protein
MGSVGRARSGNCSGLPAREALIDHDGLRVVKTGSLIKYLARLPQTAGDWFFNSTGYARFRKREHVLCIGDSHVRVMSHVRVPGFWFRVISVEGATASGIMNPNGTAQAMPIFTSRLNRARSWQRVLVQLGEVDCGFVIWHRAERRSLSIDEQLAYTLDAYEAFIERLVASSFREVIVLSAPAPTISDDPVEWGDVANLRSEVSATQIARTDLTLRFNAQLKKRCAAIGASFVDITTGHMDERSGLIDARFLRTTPEDHHLADSPYAALISRELSVALDHVSKT